MNDSLKSIANELKNVDSVLIFPHINMDGDSLGSSTALCLALRELGKKAFVILNEPIPKNLDFLECGCSTYEHTGFDNIELSIQVDCSGMKRILGREEAWERGRLKGCIDHHPSTSSDIKFDFYRTEPNTAATGEIIFRLIKELGVDLNLDMANCIFASITTDTGNFQHSNTTRETHEIAAKIHSIDGFNVKKISSLLYDRRSKEAIRMESEILSNLEFYSEGKIAVGEVTQAILDKFGCSMNESEGIVQRIMSVDGVEVGCVFKEKEKEIIMISLRAKYSTNVAAIASKFGGGGHLRAAGCRMRKPLGEAKELLIPELVKAIDTDV